MDYRLLYTQRALNDLAEIVGHLAKDDPEAAARFGAGLLDHLDLLARFPRMGALSEEGRRCASWPTAPFWFTIRSTKINA